jgi:hypothetical protein
MFHFRQQRAVGLGQSDLQCLFECVPLQAGVVSETTAGICGRIHGVYCKDDNNRGHCTYEEGHSGMHHCSAGCGLFD